ncbi:MAG: hypothetical protein ACP5UJ_05280 [Athalassotoga sp.]|uniref:hypothetical protein n=1 Tax=Athalassotoga sp. TaxID=2022597 RepID=UPI003D00E770
MKKSIMIFSFVILAGILSFAGTASSTNVVNWSNLPYTLSATVESHTIFGTKVDFHSAVKDGALDHYSAFDFEYLVFTFNRNYIDKLPYGITILTCSINRNFFSWVVSSKEYPWGKVSISAPAVGMIEMFVVGGVSLYFLITHDPLPMFYGLGVLTVENFFVSSLQTNCTIILDKEKTL